MPAKKRTRPNQKKAKTSAASKRPAKKASKKKLTVRKKTPKKLAKKKAAHKMSLVTTKAKTKKTITVKTAREIDEQIQDKRRAVYRVGSTRVRQGRVFSGRQSGDLEGLSRAEGADSESVDELLEEGNPFEAEAVAGVEEADEADEREVHTHEAPEDDVPDEYLDKD
jgi:hypothetical protein